MCCSARGHAAQDRPPVKDDNIAAGKDKLVGGRSPAMPAPTTTVSQLSSALSRGRFGSFASFSQSGTVRSPLAFIRRAFRNEVY